jgi:hypothetical protein
MPSSNTIALIAVLFLVSGEVVYSRPNAVIDTRVHKAEFALTDAEKLFSSVFGGRLAKSEFETEAQYRSRTEQMRPKGTYFLLIPSTSLRYVYRAELQRLVVMAPQVGAAITVASWSKDLGKVPMQNAFGATVETSVFKQRLLSLEIQNVPRSFPKGVVWQAPSNVSTFFPDVGLGLPVSIAPAAAERVVKNKSFGLLVGFTVADLSRARHDRGGVAPTFDAPVGIAGDTSTLPVNVSYLAVLDRNTNDVVTSCTFRP